MMERTKWDNGPHHIWFEAPDILHITAEAVVEAEHSIEAARVINEEVMPHVSQLFLIVHLYPGGVMSPAARRNTSTVAPVWSGVAIVGGSAMQRAAMNIIFRALSLLSSEQPPSRLVGTIEAAYAFINDLRSANQAQVANS